MRPIRIKSLVELQHEQHRLKRQMEFTRNAFSRSVNNTAHHGRDFVLKKIMIPAGAAGLGLFTVKKLFSSSDNHNEKESDTVWEQKDKRSGSKFAKLMMLGIPLVQQYFMKKKAHQKVEKETRPDHVTVSRSSENKTDWLSTLVPAVAPVLQHYFANKDASEEQSEVTVEQKETGHGQPVNQVKIHQNAPSTMFDWMFKLLPVVLPLVQQHFFNKEVEQQVNEPNKPPARTAIKPVQGDY